MIDVNPTSKTEHVKQRTIELYDSLPQVYDERLKRLDVRDEVIELNYLFFGYVASHTYVNNSTVTYEDKFQSAVLHFCECWWKWKWNGDEKHRGYRSDLSFAVFFKPRISEMIERELTEIRYSIRRTLCMEAGDQLGKHWSKVTYDDLKDVNLPQDKLESLKAIFGASYKADLADFEPYLENQVTYTGEFDDLNERFDTVEELLIHDMIILESKLSDKELHKMSEMYGIDFNLLKSKRPIAETMLYRRLKDSLDLRESF